MHALGNFYCFLRAGQRRDNNVEILFTHDTRASNVNERFLTALLYPTLPMYCTFAAPVKRRLLRDQRNNPCQLPGPCLTLYHRCYILSVMHSRSRLMALVIFGICYGIGMGNDQASLTTRPICFWGLVRFMCRFAWLGVNFGACGRQSM